METKKPDELTEKKELSGDELLKEYFGQDKQDKHNMGYSVYGQTASDGCCC
ncbi:MAG: hypothetical protein NC131_06860 [Roseburia sp.]|nr:hypothetical protein [Roseburia sp.]